MIQTKLFVSETVEDIDVKINYWIQEHPMVEIIDVKHSICYATLNVVYSALIVYDSNQRYPKPKVVLECSANCKYQKDNICRLDLCSKLKKAHDNYIYETITKGERK